MRTDSPPIDVVSKKLLHVLGVEAETKGTRQGGRCKRLPKLTHDSSGPIAYAEIALQQAEKLLATLGNERQPSAEREGEPTFSMEDLRATIAYWHDQLARPRT